MNTQSHILIIDDDHRILKLLQEFLTKNGYLVSASQSSRNAMLLLQQFNYDLIILDVMMPDITGIEFAEKMQHSGDHTPIVMLTALSEPENKQEAIDVGVQDYLTKPFDPDELLIKIHNLLKHKTVSMPEKESVSFGDYIYNSRTKELMRNKHHVILSLSEEKLLDILLLKSNNVVTIGFLSEQLGNLSERLIEEQITSLKNKIMHNAKDSPVIKKTRQGYVLYRGICSV